MNRDPDAYRYKLFNGSKNFQEHLEHLFLRRRASLRFILSKLLHFILSKLLLFFSNSLPFFFVSFRNMPINRFEIRIYELKGSYDQLYNLLLKSIGLQIIHLKKWKALLIG
ncbi:Protein Ycf2 [Bienertia sinuspersici]